jgi:hypothetical protein
VYIRHKWTELEGKGWPIVEPAFMEFGTSMHYSKEDGLKNFGKAELADKNLKTIAFYRFTSPIVLTIDPELIKVNNT